MYGVQQLNCVRAYSGNGSSRVGLVPWKRPGNEATLEPAGGNGFNFISRAEVFNMSTGPLGP